MDEEDNIHMRLELCRDKKSNELVLKIHFDPNAPNFFKNDSSYSWVPTLEEIKFVSKGFDLITTSKINNSYEKTTSLENRATSEPPVYNKEKTNDIPPLEKTEETISHNSTRDNPRYKNPDDKVENIDKISADESDRRAIEKALERYQEKDNSLSEFDKQKIIEKILSHEKERYLR